MALALLAGADFDLIVHGGRIVDGTGNPAFVGDVGITRGRIVAVGPLEGKTGARTIQAKGLIVAPGFVDMHNHSDAAVIADGNAESMIRQGVTSMILGEGVSVAPTTQYPGFADYFKALKVKGVSTNIGSYVGSGLIWTSVRGQRSGAPTKEELVRMQALVKQAMQQGALGVSSSLGFPPGAWIDTDTLVAMCEAAAPSGGIYATHTRTEGQGVFASVAEAIEIGKRAGVAVDLLHLKIADKKLWGQVPQLIATIAAARAAGQSVEANVYPYVAGHNSLASIIPPWAHEGGHETYMKRLRDPALRARLSQEVLNGIPGDDWYDHYTAVGGWEGMMPSSFSNPAYKKFEGKRMSEVIAALGGAPIDAFFKTLIDNGGSVPTIFFHHTEKDMQYILQQPFVSVGSDGSALTIEGPLAEGVPHPRSYGTFPRVLGRYVRQQKLLSLEEAVRKMTSANTAKVHLFDRGLLRPGQWADVTIFNPDTVIDNATYEKPKQYATGIEFVIVNGAVVLDKGRHTGLRPGMVLYGAGKR